MSTWEDTIALLRAGAPPTRVLPNLRNLLQNLPSPPSPPSAPPPRTPTSNLYHTLSGEDFQIPYLRPPPHLWRYLSEGDQGGHADLFDGEIEVDVLSLFRPRFVEPPVGDILLADVKLVEDSLSAEEKEPGAKEPEVTEPDYEHLAARLANSDLIDALPPLSEEQWSSVVSLAPLPSSAHETRELLRLVNQPSFSRVMLASVVPLLALEDGDMIAFLEVVEAAVSLSELGKVPVDSLREIVNVFEGLGVYGSLAQVRIVCRR